MKVLFTGAGSIGVRHINNLYEICTIRNIKLEIDVIRLTNRVLPKQLKNIISREIHEDTELREEYDAIFLTDETKTHYENMIKYLNRSNNFFIEKPIFEAPNYDISQFEKSGKKMYVASPIRFSKYYEMLKKVADENEIYSARIIFSSYMPNWQKGRDYTKSFRCFEERGGGVDIDSLHEIDYMTALFGIPKSVKRMVGKYSNLQMDACDLATYLFQYEDKVIEMHLDYFGRVNNRRVEFFAKDDVIVVDYNTRTCNYLLSGVKEEYGIDDQFYQNEMNYFVDYISDSKGVINTNTISNAYESLKLAKGII